MSMGNGGRSPADTDPGEVEELGELQVAIAELLLRHVWAPLVGDQHVRGVLPAPDGAEAVRVVVGPRRGSRHPVAYEVPLRAEDGDLRTTYSVVALLRAQLAVVGSLRTVGTVMGMPLARVDPEAVGEAPFTKDDWAETLLSTLARPRREGRSRVRLRGYLFRAPERLRLYLDSSGVVGVIAADVRPGGALTALLAMLSPFDEEEWRRDEGADDPHATRVFDYTDL
ncbi:hypothetical protein ACSMX9_08320 [Streptomyces sp. LE64]|uniref:hypothetical protein n=1 Tax=Streptomyces sp. LE64 TaxID=3448653 RepID=UPI004041354D